MSRPTTLLGRARFPSLLASCAVLSFGLLAGCDENGNFALPQSGAPSAEASTSTKLVERDVEAPEVFSATEEGLWDGRPSLGGVWVAHPDVTDPERVIIRNQSNGKFVIGALFRRERDLPGPKLQISSDAAQALAILAGAPAPLNVTALRRQEAEPPATPAAPTGVEGDIAPADVSQTSLDPVAPAPSSGAETVTPRPEPTASAPVPRTASAIDKPYVQLGIFSVEANATRTAKQMRAAGMVPTVRRSEINGKPFWRVLVGPAGTQSELAKLLKSIKTEGFSDAYAVAN